MSDAIYKVIERYLFHSGYKSDNPMLQDIAKSMADIEILEMWLLTQNNNL